MAEAIQRVIPEVQLVYGPALEHGFYYDMAVPDGRPIREDDFTAIEMEMADIIAEDRPFTRYVLVLEDGLSKLRDEGSKYKIDNAQRAAEAGSDTLTWYATGEPGTNWEDLCRGPHAPSTGRIGAAKIMSVAASYWHGDADSDQLTRVYGTAFFDQASLDAHLEQLEEARQRDHRVIGRQLHLFAIDEMVGQGLVLWTPRGAVLRNELQRFIGEELKRQGYHEVFTPHIGKLDLYRTSGHYPYYRDSQYPPLIDPDQLQRLADESCSCAELTNMMKDGDIEGYLLKPMNCPHHIRIYASEPRSYRDLPLRLNEFGTVYRYEQSGELGGMTRVRGFTQDDAHLFCTEAQIADEVAGCLEIVKIIFKTLKMDDYRVRVGLRDPDGDKYVGNPANWDKAEAACRDAAASLGVPFSEEAGEAAFYGPKIDFVVRDVIGREWQLGTPGRLQPAGTIRSPLRRLRQRASSSGDDPPGPLRIMGTVHWRADRTLRRSVPDLAGPRTGLRTPGQREECGLCPVGPRSPAGNRHSLRDGQLQRTSAGSNPDRCGPQDPLPVRGRAA